MAGRFGKYGEAKRKALIRKNRLRPPDLRQAKKKKIKNFLKGERLQGYSSLSTPR
jgi:hypothetical protein